MAGTLTVQTLQGPSSGANANKLLIPSGQTLDASGGTLVPSAGQILKTHLHQWTDTTTITTTTLTDVTGSSFNYTPDSSSSKLFIQYTYHWYRASSSNGSGLEVVLNINGSSQNTVNAFEHYIGGLTSTFYSRGHKIDTYTNTATTAIPIKLQFRGYDTTDRVDINQGGFISSIYVQEIAQ
jgi:hypothetical protein